MKSMTSTEVRQAFLDFFNEVNHEIVDSSPLPNYDNPTLLFTNAGMNQFTDLFLGKEKRSYTRAVTSQKVMRVSGKHNDLENVGPSLRHHTFFEMLGNFSFGDYFKAEAIDFAWNFMTKVIGLDPERLYATVYNGLKDGKPFMQADDEAAELWQRYLPAERVRGYSYDDNYWVMGDTGPNGPCSELHYYQGDLDNVDISLLNNDDDVDEAFVELWNLVFMQYSTDENGKTTPLPKPSIDTGMGLERLVRILQGVENNYESDVFSGAMDKVQELLGDDEAARAEHLIGYRVIADHGRAATFLIGDGVIPGNTGAPYVLRMIVRRAARFGRKIGFSQPFLADIAQVYIDQMGDAYPDIVRRADFIKKTLTGEEEKFNATINRAQAEFDKIVAELERSGSTVIPGKRAFRLHDTYGLPIEITRDLAKEIGFTIDEAGFEEAKEAHAIASGKGAFGEYDISEQIYSAALEDLIENGTLSEDGVTYEPYGDFSAESTIVGMFKSGSIIESADEGDQVEIITIKTPFYINSGGQISDTGTLTTDTGSADVVDMNKQAGLITHVCIVTNGTLTVGSDATLTVDNVRRQALRRNHTATHILHEELRQRLGTHVTQQGSLVAPDRLRFDFSHDEAVHPEVLAEIEGKINAAILQDYDVSAEEMPKDDAIALGAMALFGEKYGDIVRTVQIGDKGSYSLELCGGLHVGHTSEIGSFHFVSEGSAAAGVRRVEAVTGEDAQEFVASRISTLQQVARKLNSSTNDVIEKVDALVADNRQLQKEIEQLRRGIAKAQFEQLFSSKHTIKDTALMVGHVDNVTTDGLREMTDWFRNRVDSGAIVLATVNNDKPIFIAAVTDDLIKRGLKAGDLVREMGKHTGGGGGGRPNLAQAGGRDVAKLDPRHLILSQL